jgi:cell division protein FtsB
MPDRQRSTTATKTASRRERPARERVAPRVAGARPARSVGRPLPAKRRVAGREPERSVTPARPPASARVTRRRRLLVCVLGLLALVGFLFAFVYPTRTFLAQRDEISRARERLDVLRRATADLEHDTQRLRGDAEVERIAREQYGLVRPGETSYVLVPRAPAPTTPEPSPSPTP